ncbi:MAG TPA: fibronectin type III domain-containing protein, partial [Bacteroidales bacterium]|nr:fibronectin type III domain-containing protein [Bacteroidales bacterium]
MRNVLLPIFLFLCIAASAQDTIQVNYVTINPTGPNVTINWKQAPHPGDGYIICQYGKTPGHGLDYNFFVGNITSYTFQFNDVNQVPVQFAILSYTGTPTNIIDRSVYKRPIHRTMFAGLAYDSCSSEIKMTWTHYIGWGTDLMGYTIIDDNTGLQVASIAASDSTFTFSNVNANRVYKYHVRANHKNGTYTSNSNFVSIYTKAMSPPGFINVRNVEVVQNSLAQITYFIDPTSQHYNFRLLRSNKPNTGFHIVNEYKGYTSSILTVTDESLGDSTIYYKL